MASDRAAGSQVAPTPEATNWGFDFMVVGTFCLFSGGKYFVPPQDSTDAQQEIPMKFLQFVYIKERQTRWRSCVAWEIFGETLTYGGGLNTGTCARVMHMSHG
jgi:hypothetical protein